MARSKMSPNPVKGGVRRRRNTQPAMQRTGTDSSVIQYSALGAGVTSSAIGTAVYNRMYVPGNAVALNNGSGASIVSFYSSGKFNQGTKIRWEPSVSFTTSGRIYVGFTDNPEIMATLNGLYAAYQTTPTLANYNAYANQVKALGSVQSFPVWQETDVMMPLDTRRKRFDINSSIDFFSADVLDRSCQRGMYAAFDGGPTATTTLGSFWFNDVVSVEGITGLAT